VLAIGALLLVIACLAPIARSLSHSAIKTQTGAKLGQNIEQKVTLLSFNTLGHIDLSQALLSQIRVLNPDIIALQELSPTLAQALNTELADTYRCKILRPAQGSWGMALLSKVECQQRSITSEASWVGAPIAIDIKPYGEQTITVANIHAIHPHAGLFDTERYPAYNRQFNAWQRLSQTVQERQRSIDILLQEIGDIEHNPIIVAGDLNATARNKVYQHLRQRGLGDAWLTLKGSLSGGGTWPAPKFIGSSALGWLLRIDFIFYSPALTPERIELLPETLGSDHRGLFAEMKLHRDPKTFRD
jgi:endonuclease/exonuclease/phosphatase (EEP) superfamily protein YafD